MPSEKVCPQCGTRYEADHMFCFLDGAALIQAQNSTDLVGSIIADRYRVLSKLGDGGMGQVFLAEHVRMKRRCAVKIMRPALMSDPVAVVRFNREAENASQISHPNVCAVYDFGETPTGLIYLAMEFIDGEALSKILAREEWLLHVRAADIISQTADALSAAHGLGILHRDLKPDNIMVTKSRAGTDHVKIVDFGIARVMSKESQQLTSTGIAVGTPEYMSPEQFAGDAVDARTDIYALALVAYHCVTGAHAFGSGTSTDHLLARLTQPPRRLSSVKPDVEWPDALQHVFDRALAPDPAARYPDVLEFARDFTEAVAQMPVTTTEEHYLSAIASRRLTPPRSFTPAAGIPSIDSVQGPAPVREKTGSTSGSVPAWSGPDANVAVTTPSGERPTERLSMGDVGTLGRGDVPPGEHTAPPSSPSSGDDGQDEAGEAPTVTMPASPAARRRRIGGVLAAVGILVAAVLVAVLVPRPPAEPNGDAPAPAPAPPAVVATPAPDTTTATVAQPDSGTTDSVATASSPSATGLALDSAVAQMRRGVVAVVSSEGRGTGFLADTVGGAGLIVTSAALVSRDSAADVQFDGRTRVRARAAALDRSAGIAVLAVGLRPWSRYRVLPLATGDSVVKGGDSLAALGSMLAPPAVRRGAARGGTDGSVRPGFAVNRADFGRPIVSAGPAPAVIALATQRGAAQGGFATAGAVDALVRDARRRLGRKEVALPDERLVPAWPTPAYPLDAIRESSRRDSIDLAPYRTSTPGFRIFLMTPPVLAWRDSAIARTRAYWQSPFQLGKYVHETYDPIERWTGLNGFRATVGERRPVVVLSVVPDGVPEVRYRSDPTVGDPRSEVRSMRLLRDNQPVPALDSARFVAVVNPKDYQDRRRPVRDERLLVFRLDELSRPGAYTVEVVNANGNRRTVATLSQPLLDAIRRDAARWRPAR